MRNFMFLSVIVFLVFAGCGKEKPKYTQEELDNMPHPQRTGLPAPTGGFVLAVGDDTITSDEVTLPLMERFRTLAQTTSLESFKVQAREAMRMSVTNRISDILLYQRAWRDAGEDLEEKLDKAVEAETRKFLTSFGGDYAKAEEFLKNKMGMDWQSFREYQRRTILSGSYLYQKLPEEKPVTYSDLMSYYNIMKEDLFSVPDTVTFRLIDIDVDKVESASSKQSQLEKARKLAGELIERLNNSEDFGELAKQYSHGYRAALGGLWNPVKGKSLAEPYDILAAEAEKMQPGDITGPLEKGGHIFIMKLEERQNANVEPFENVQEEIEQVIILERKKEAFNEVMFKFVGQANIANVDEFVEYCLEKAYAKAKAYEADNFGLSQ